MNELILIRLYTVVVYYIVPVHEGKLSLSGEIIQGGGVSFVIWQTVLFKSATSVNYIIFDI